ncbi:MAG: ABC transporter substrate-binding protein, partial [Clostridiales bacterium]|nr:ABC transporter substrate-binding protein [Clostridiales bacterium]
MNRFTLKNAILFTISAAFLLSLCSCERPADINAPDDVPEETPASIISAVNPADHLFTVRYEAGYSFNPITGTSPDNMALVPLMYEGLFILNEKMEAEPVLCEEYATSDGINYIFKLKSGIAMRDGSTLSAADAKYTLTQAMQGGRFSGRLNIIDSITAADTLTLEITLRTANRKLPELLDIPIVKTGTADQNHPPGSGPYYYEKTGTPRLVLFENYRDADKMPVPVIYLKDCDNAELSVAFSSQAVDLFRDDPADSSEINILSDHEIRYYNTTILQYVGFNTKNSLLANADLRRAFGLIIDRKDIVSSVYSSHALAAPLVLSPHYRFYDPAWENKTSDPLAKLSEIFASLGMDDVDSDGFLEIPNGGGYSPITLTFIVNGDNPYKVRAAQIITDTLKTVGIDVNLTKLSWVSYKAALESGSFDLYYGDVCLPANYDLTELLSPGGSLDYGHAGEAEYQTRINYFLAASGEDR